ncbi:hypothetical protein BRYFOR_08532 [Marvinbryantia formatexigens DSM 14469]|uniref:Uncharacterized protein n=1 Tax=Marvinbryantia formatexigens DSM 14469 TaxID=478749 RepID=C6LIQ2_9FIRM|nr:hypothetical protein BRYFOR_08532 [Marvinbryantia formatexigens DSM 14469]
MREANKKTPGVYGYVPFCIWKCRLKSVKKYKLPWKNPSGEILKTAAMRGGGVFLTPSPYTFSGTHHIYEAFFSCFLTFL